MIIKNIPIKAKMFSFYAFLSIISLIIGYTGYKTSKAIQSNLKEIHTRKMPAMDYLIEADRDLQQLLVAERSMIFTDTKSENFKKFVSDYNENMQQSAERWAKYRALASSPEEQAIIPKYERARKEWEVLSRRVVDSRIEDTRDSQ